MTKLLDRDPIWLMQRELFQVWDDFPSYTDAQLWTKVIGSTGTVSVANGQGGVLAIANAASGNDADYVHTTNKPFIFAQDQPLIAEARLQLVEANTNQANFFFGFCSLTSGYLQNANAGFSTSSASSALIFKLGGGSQWQTLSSVGTTQNITKANTLDINGNPSDGNYHTLRIEVQPISSTIAEVRYFVDGLQLRPVSPYQTTVMGIVDQLTYTSAVAMGICFGVLNGSASAETLSVDYAYGGQNRYATGIYH